MLKCDRRVGRRGRNGGKAGGGNVVCVMSGNIDATKLAKILEGGVP